MIPWTIATLVALVLLAFARGAYELRRSVAQVQASLLSLQPDRIEDLYKEGVERLRERLRIELPDELEAAAAQLDQLTRSPRIKEAFATPELYWRFVLPLGALVGELIRRHGKARWEHDPQGGLVLRVALPDGRELTSRPFDRVLRHRLSGRPGELKAYILFAAQDAANT
jgi:hypothetical protein